MHLTSLPASPAPLLPWQAQTQKSPSARRKRKHSLVDITKAADTETTALPSGGRISDTVGAHLEPVTRFGRDDITQDAPDLGIAVDLTLTLVQKVHFDVVWNAGPRQLPKDITLLANGTRLKVELNTQLNQARAGCDDAVRAWVSQEPMAYRRVLPPDAAFRHTPGRYGIEFTCQNCYGKRQVECDGCAGAGRTSCDGCQGAGTVHCHQCGGTSRITCTGCLGSGHYTEQVSEQRWDGAADRFVTDYKPVNRPCLSCSGSGSTHCISCTFGQAQCPTCAGKRTVTCKGCGGAGCFDCAPCEATGIQHEWAGVTASVSVAEELTFGLVDAPLQTIIRERIAPGALPDYGSYLEAHHVVDNMALGSRYQLRIDALYARLHAAARHVGVYALGPKAQVLDFVNIAGHLLEDDLVTLERAAEPVPLWSRPKDSTLLYALKQFVDSELNLLIAEHSGAQQAATAVEAHFRSMVDAAYVVRATVALRNGFNRLYGADLARPALWVAGGAGVLSALVYAFGPSDYGPWNCTGWAMLGGAVAWIGVEMASLSRIMRSFPEQIGARLHSQIKAGGGVTRWRLAVAAGVVASALLTVTLAAKVPFIRHRHDGPVIAHVQEKAPVPAPPASIEQSRSNTTQEGLFEIRQEARKFLIAHNKKHKTSFKALSPNLNEQYPKCKSALVVGWVPKSSGLSKPALSVRCKKSASEHQRKWESIVPVARSGGK